VICTLHELAQAKDNCKGNIRHEVRKSCLQQVTNKSAQEILVRSPRPRLFRSINGFTDFTGFNEEEHTREQH
jgi:hypothetical protein